MMHETKPNGRWPKALHQKDWDQLLDIRGYSEVEARYGKKVQQLCRTPGFGLMAKVGQPGWVDREPLEKITTTAKENAPMLSKMITSIGPSRNSQSTHLMAMKIVAVLVILCRTAHRNNSSYLPLLIVLYLYSAGARVDAITLLNRLGLTVSYNVLQKRLKNIAVDSACMIKKEAINPRMVGT